MFCADCGKPLGTGVKFCQSCGAAVPGTAATTTPRKAGRPEARAGERPLEEAIERRPARTGETPRRGKVDWEGVWMAWGIGLAGMAMGGLVLWALASGGLDGKGKAGAYSTAQHAVRLLPENVKGWIALIGSVVMLVLGLGFVVMGFVFLFRRKRGG